MWHGQNDIDFGFVRIDGGNDSVFPIDGCIISTNLNGAFLSLGQEDINGLKRLPERTSGDRKELLNISGVRTLGCHQLKSNGG